MVRLGDGVFALGDRCTHQDVSLSAGEVDEDECTLECPKHGAAFRLDSGEPTCLPATQPVPRRSRRRRRSRVPVLSPTDTARVTSQIATAVLDGYDGTWENAVS